MKNKLQRFLLFLVLLPKFGYAYDFEVDGFFYNILDSTKHTVEMSQGQWDGGDFDLYIPESVTYDNTTYSVVRITFNSFRANSIYLPKSVYDVDVSSLSVNSFWVDEENTVYSSENGILYSKDKKVLIRYPNQRSDVQFTVSSQTDSIADYAFSDCALQSVTIGCRAIGNFSFYDSSNLKSIVLNEGVISIGNLAFSFCRSLEQVNIPVSLEKIGKNPFNQCISLCEIDVAIGPAHFIRPNGVLYTQDGKTLVCYPAGRKEEEYRIGDLTTCVNAYAFASSHLKHIEMPNSVRYIGEGCFNNSENLVSLKISEELRKLPSYSISFCNKLEELVIPNKVDSIENQVCWTCRSLKKITFGESVRFIGRLAFASCENVTIVKSYAVVPPFCEFLGLDFHPDAVVYVPLKSVEAYKAADIWKDYKILPFPEDLLNSMINTAEDLLNQNTGENWTKHGLLHDADQLTTNLRVQTNKELYNLLDGDKETFFEGTWDFDEMQGEKPFLQANLHKALQFVKFKYLCPNDENRVWNAQVLATNDLENGWTEVCDASLSSTASCINIDLGKPYRYVRFIFEGVDGNGSAISHFSLVWNELGIWNGATISNQLRKDATGLIKTAIQELNNNSITTETIEALENMITKLQAGDILSLYENDATHIIYPYKEQQTAWQEVEYVRDYKHTEWQALYVPFAIQYNDISDDFVVAKINNLHQFDDDDDGNIDRTQLEIIRLKADATIKANTPYMIKAKTTGVQTIKQTVSAVEGMTSASINCSSTDMEYSFVGTYAGLPGDAMNSQGYYAMVNGELCQAETDEASLGQFRWYMNCTPRYIYGSSLAPRRISVVEAEGEATGIDSIEFNTESAAPQTVYDLSGRVVSHHGLQGLRRGLYLVNGKKIMR